MNEYTILIPLLIQIFGIIPVVLTDKYIQRSQRLTMMNIITLIMLLVAQNSVEYVLKTSLPMPYFRTLISILGYILRPAILVFFCELVAPHRKHFVAWGLFGAHSLAYLTATFV